MKKIITTLLVLFVSYSIYSADGSIYNFDANPKIFKESATAKAKYKYHGWDVKVKIWGTGVNTYEKSLSDRNSWSGFKYAETKVTKTTTASCRIKDYDVWGNGKATLDTAETYFVKDTARPTISFSTSSSYNHHSPNLNFTVTDRADVHAKANANGAGYLGSVKYIIKRNGTTIKEYTYSGETLSNATVAHERSYPSGYTGTYNFKNYDSMRVSLSNTYFNVDGSYEVIVYAEDKVGNHYDSNTTHNDTVDPLRKTFIIDTVNPVINNTNNHSDTNTYTGSSYKYEYSITDTNFKEVQLYKEEVRNGRLAYYSIGKYYTKNNNIEVNTTGTHKYRIIARDNAGNSASKYLSITTDFNKPIVNGITSSNLNTKEVKLTISATDIGSDIDFYEYCINDSDWVLTGNSGNNNWFTVDGNCLVKVRVTDNADNTSVVDSNPKAKLSVSSINSPDISISSNDIPVNGLYTSNVLLKKENAIFNVNIDTAGSAGLNSVKLSYNSREINIKNILDSSSNPGAFNSTTISGIEIKRSSDYLYTIRLNTAVNGSTNLIINDNLKIAATDYLNNNDESTYTINMDNEKPTLSIKKSPDYSIIKKEFISDKDWSFKVSLTPTDSNLTMSEGKFTIKLDDNDISGKLGETSLVEGINYNLVYTLGASLEPGVHTLSFQVTDDFGNKSNVSDSTKFVFFNPKGLKPVLSDVGTNGSFYLTENYVKDNITFNFNNFNPVSVNGFSGLAEPQKTTKETEYLAGVFTYEYSFGNNQWENFSPTAGGSLNISVNGSTTQNISKTIYIRVKDIYGNYSDQKTIDFTVDQVKPDITINSNINSNTWSKNNVELSLTSTEVVDFYYYYVGQTGSHSKVNKTENNQYKINFSNNINKTYKIYSLDSVGNRSDEEDFIVKIDKTFPVISNPFLDGASLFNDKLLIKAKSDICNEANLSILKFSILTSNNTPVANAQDLIYDGVNSIKEYNLKSNNLSGDYKLIVTAVDSAGNTTPASYDFVVDNGEPYDLSFDLIFNSNDSIDVNDTKCRGTIILNNVSATDDVDNTLDYAFHLGTYNSATNKYTYSTSKLNLISDSYTFPSNIPDGQYKIKLAVKDDAGNSNYKESSSFYLDTEAPNVNDITIEIKDDAAVVLGDNDLTSIANLSINLLDSVGNSSDHRYKVKVSDKAPVLFDSVFNESDWNLLGYHTGDISLDFTNSNYIYVKIADGAGNLSESYKYRVLRYDNSPVQAPSIPDIKEVFLATEALPESNPSFTLVDNNSGNLVATKFRYTLKGKVYKSTSSIDSNGIEQVSIEEKDYSFSNEVSHSAGTNTIISFTDLWDNLAGEFYELSVVAISNNGNESPATIKKFRIDTTPPETFTIAYTSHTTDTFDPLESNIYSYSKASFEWQKPEDMTGIKRVNFKYRINNGNYINGIESDITYEQGKYSLDLDFEDSSVFPNNGTVELVVTAFDVNEKSNEDSITVNYDLREPSVEITNILNDLDSLTTTITYTLSENTGSVSGEMILDGSERGVTKSLNGLTSQTWGGMSLNNDYKLALIVSTNTLPTLTVPSYTYITFKNGTTSEIIREPVEEDFYKRFSGFEVKGVINKNNSTLTRGSLTTPNALLNVTANSLGQEMELSDILVTELNDFVSAKVPALNKNLIINGLRLNNSVTSDAAITSDNGLAFSNRILSYDINEAVPYNFNISNVQVESGTDFSFSSSNTVLDPSISIYTKYDNNSSWIIGDVSVIKLKDNSLFALNGKIATDNITNLTVKNDDKTENIYLTNVKLGIDRQIVIGEVTDNYNIALGAIGNLLNLDITDSYIEGNKLKISEADILFEDNLIYNSLGESIVPKIYNLVIDDRGNIDTSEMSFTPFYIKFSDDFYFLISDLDVSTSGVKGSGKVVNKDFSSILQTEFDSFELATSGYSDSLNANFINEKITLNFHGFNLDIDKADLKLTSSSVKVNKATINLSKLGNGLTSELTDFELNYSLDSVLVSNKGNSDVTVNNSLTINKLTLSDTSLTANTSTFILPKLDTGSSFYSPSSVTIKDMPISSVSGLGAGVLDSIYTNLSFGNGFVGEFNSGIYSQGELTIPTIDILLPNGARRERLKLSNFKLGATPNHSEYTEELVYEKDGWIFHILSPVFTSEGITGKTVLEFKVLDSDNIESNKFIPLDNFLLKHDDSYVGNIDSSTVIDLELFGYNLKAANININSVDIIFNELKFESRDGNNSLLIEGLRIDNTGNVTNGTGSTGKNIKSRNGFTFIPSSFNFGAEGLLLKGGIKLPDYFNYKVVDIETESVLLDPNWNIKTNKIVKEISAEVRGVPVTLNNFLFYEDGLFIGSSKITLDQGLISINNSIIKSNGEVESGGFFGDVEEVKISGWKMYAKSAYFSNDGIRLNSNLILPEELGAPSIYLDDLTLYKTNGKLRFYSNTIINNLEFSHNEMEFSFDRIQISPDSLSVVNGLITLPNNDIFEGKQVGISHFRIGSDGSFFLSGSKVDPLNIMGYEIYLRELSLNDSLLNLEGSLKFPYDFAVTELAGSVVSIEELSYNFSTYETTFDLVLDKFSIEIADGWRAEVNGLNLNNSGFEIASGSLYFPNNWLENISIEKTTFTNLKYDFNSGFSIGGIALNNLKVNCEGYEFTITSASYNGSTFKLAGEFPLTGLFEGEMTDPLIKVDNLEIGEGFNIIALDAAFDTNGVDLGLTKNREVLYNGSIGIDSNFSDSFRLKLSGQLKISETSQLPEIQSVSGTGSDVVLNIESFIYDVSNNEISRLKAEYTNTEVEVLDAVVKDLILGVDYTQGDENIILTLGGAFPVPENYPGIGGELFNISSTFDLSGNFYNLESGIVIQNDKPMLDSFVLKKGSSVQLKAIISEYTPGKNRLSGLEFTLKDTSLVFSNTFDIENLRGSNINITTLVIDTEAGFKECDLSFTTPANMKLYDDLILVSGSITLKASTDKSDIITTVTGSLQLPDDMGGILIDIDKFEVTSSGMVDIIASASVTDKLILNEVKLVSGTLGVTGGTSGNLDFDLSGDFKLVNTSVPQEIRDLTLYGSVEFSTVGGIGDFSIGITDGSPLVYEFIDGVEIKLARLVIGSEGFESVVTSKIEKGFYGIDASVSASGIISFNWNWEILESDIVFEGFSVVYAGLGCDIEGFRIDGDGVTFEQATLLLPETLGSQKVGVKDGGFNDSSGFYGDFVVEELNIELLGCKVKLVEPNIDSENERITCVRSEFVLPDALGSASIGLDDVVISSGALSVGGGDFELPDINTGALVFSNMGATLKPYVDNSGKTTGYEIGARGQVFIEGVGEVEAGISLVPIDPPTYPIGLKYALFSFEAQVGGIPLGTTGLLINGLRGCLAFGPPGIDMPEYLRTKFGPGMRISLGISITEPSSMVIGRSDMWLNLDNADWALRGELEFLKGTFTSHAMALYTQSYGLELSAGLNVNLVDKVFLDGLIRAHIFEYLNKSRFCGEATVTASVKDILWGFPEDKMEIGKIGIAVGDFVGERRGFMGYASIDWLGKVGFYVDESGSFDTDISEYTLLDQAIYSRSANTFARSYSFSTRSETKIKPRGPSATTDRIIFAVQYSEGDPRLVAIDPLGNKYYEGDENVKVHRTSDKIFMVVLNPMPGNWDINVENLTKDSKYETRVFGINKNPEIRLDTPVFNRESVGSSYELNGNFGTFSGEEPTITFYLSREKGVYNGVEVGSFKPSSNGDFSYTLDTQNIVSGEYYLYAGVYDGKSPDVFDYADGSIVVINSVEDAEPINDLVIGYNDNKILNISFTDDNRLTKGYKLNIRNNETGDVELVNIGYLKTLTLSRLNNADSYSISVLPYDAEGKLGKESNVVEINYSEINTIENKFNISAEPVNVAIGTAGILNILVTPESYIESGDANDYVEYNIKGLPPFITQASEKNRLKLNNVSSFNVDLVCNEKYYVYNEELDEDELFYAEPGLYDVVIEVINKGNDSIKEEIILTLNVTYKNPEISNVIGDQWHIYDPVSLTIKGDGFTKESTVSIGGVEVEITEQNISTLKVNVPVLNISNNGIIEVRNPGANPDFYSTKLIKPSFQIVELNHNSTIRKGDKGWLYSKVKGENRFEQSVDFTLVNYPDGWNINITNSVNEGGIFLMEVEVPSSEDSGLYALDVNNGVSTIRYIVNVSNDYPLPNITGLSSNSGNWGDEITIYGYGFNPGSEVYINNNKVNTIRQEKDSITFIVPDGAVSGYISVERAGIRSNDIEFEIRDDNFSIYPAHPVINMIPGESVKERVFIRGYADFVNLELEVDSSVIASLNKNQVIPNGEVELEIFIPETTLNGTYSIKLKGSGVRNSKDKVIILNVGGNIKLSNSKLITGKVDNYYSDYLKVENSTTEFSFSLENDTFLPYGLSLDRLTGEIYGTPTKAGDYSFDIKVSEGVKRSNISTFNIKVLDSGWFTPEGAEGNNRYNGTISPGEDKINWETDIDENTRNIFSAGDRIFSVSNNYIESFSRTTGESNLRLPGEFLDVEIKGDYIISNENRYVDIYDPAAQVTNTIFDDKYLVFYDTVDGREIGSFKGVEDFIVNKNFVYIVNSNGIHRSINLSNFNSEIIHSDLFTNTVVTSDGIYKTTTEGIEIYNDGVFTDILKDQDVNNFTTNKGILSTVTIDGMYKEYGDKLKEVYADVYDPKIVMGDYFSVLYNNNEAVIINKNDNSQVSINTEILEVVLTEDKLFTLSSNTLSAWNLYTGNLIWSIEGTFRELISSGRGIFAIKENKLISFQGRDNIYAPTTTMEIYPSAPNGLEGFYVTTPDFSLTTVDRESFGLAMFSVNEDVWDDYQGTTDLADGQYNLEYFSVDDQGLTENKHIYPVKIDTLPPVTFHEKNSVIGDRDYHTSNVTLSLSATDVTSDVNRIKYTLNGVENTYDKPIVVDNEGSYSFSYYSIDNAGNVESVSKEVSFEVDLFKPVISYETFESDDYGAVFFSGTDSYSGVERIEYRINNGSIKTYVDPIYLPISKYYSISYRIIDRAGLTTDWQSLTMDLSHKNKPSLIQDFDTEWGIGNRSIKENIQVGDNMYTSFWQDTPIESLPDYLIGGDMIISQYNDKFSWDDDFYEFEAGANIDLYLVKNPDSRVELGTEWNIVDENVVISDNFFPKKAIIYHRYVQQGDEVEIGGTAMWQEGGPNLIIAKRNIGADLYIFSPNPDKDLYTLDSVWFTSTSLPNEISRLWSYRVDSGNWVELGSMFSGDMDLPYIHETTDIEFKVEVKVPTPYNKSKIENIVSIRNYKLRNDSDLNFVEPVSGSQVLVNQETELDYVTTDIKGLPEYKEVQWSSSNGVVLNNRLIPEKDGFVDLTSAFNVYEDNVRESVRRLNSVTEYIPEMFTFNKELSGKYSQHDDGRSYGFSKDYKHRLGETEYVVVPEGKSWSKNRVTEMFTALEKDDSFEVLLNNGLYKIKLKTGPHKKQDFPIVYIEDKEINIDANWNKSIFEIETTIEVKDNKLTLAGSDDLQVISMEVLRVEAYGETTITQRDDYKVVKDQKWYRWNPGHYWPGLKWDWSDGDWDEPYDDDWKDHLDDTDDNKNSKKGDRD